MLFSSRCSGASAVAITGRAPFATGTIAVVTKSTALSSNPLSRIALAAAHMRRNEFEAKGAAITRALEIVGALRASLDMNVAGGLPQRLDALYDYVSRRLLHANIENDANVLDEVAGLLRVISDAWAQIAPSPRVAGAA